MAGLVAGGGAGAVALGAADGEQPARRAAAGGPVLLGGGAVPASPRSALDVPPPRRLRENPHLSVWAPVRRPVVARESPRRDAAAVARVETVTPEGTANPLLVLGRREDAAGRLWLRVRLAVLPNGTTGWVPRRSLGGYQTVRERLVVDLDRLRLTMRRNGRVVMRAPVGVGRAQWPTPRGEFYVRNRLDRYASPAYGPLAFGLSARSAELTDWPAGGFIGIHGTDRPDLLPGRVSHGCIRLRNEDVLRLGRLMPVGTPVTVR